MEITREADYAVRCVLHLAGEPGRVAMMGEIAAEREIPRPFLAKILQRLSRAGLVKSHRGVKGGFVLAREPGRITLLDVVEAIEGPVALNRCAAAADGCSLSGTCVVHPAWTRVSAEVSRILAEYDFDVLARSEGRQKGGKRMGRVSQKAGPRKVARPGRGKHV